MKKIVLLFTVLAASSLAYSQELEFGIKAGLSRDQLKLENTGTLNTSVEGNTTYNFGAFGRVKVMVIGLFVQPEIIYNTRASNITITDGTALTPFLQSASYIDVPVLIGFKFVKLVRIYAGPNFQFLVKQNTELPAGNTNFTLTDLNKNNTGIQIGAGLDLMKFRFDVKYDFNTGSMGSPFTYKGTAPTVTNGMLTFQLGIKLFGIL